MRERKIWNEYLTKFTARLEGGYLENLKEVIRRKERIVIKHYTMRLKKAGIIKISKKALMDTFTYSIFDLYYWKLRKKGTTPAEELKRFKKTINTLDKYLDEDLIYYTLKDECKHIGKLTRKNIEKIISTLRYMAESIERVHKRSLIEFSKILRNHVMFNVSKELPESIFSRKARYFGLLTSNIVDDKSSALEAIRLSIACLPEGHPYTADLFLYLTSKILRIWNGTIKSQIHAPIDSGISEVILSLGLTDKKLENLIYLSLHYEVFQTISQTLFPEDPSKMIVLRAVAERWCYDRDWKLCKNCWLNENCPKEY